MRVELDDSNCIVMVMHDGNTYTVTNVDALCAQLQQTKALQRVTDELTDPRRAREASA